MLADLKSYSSQIVATPRIWSMLDSRCAFENHKFHFNIFQIVQIIKCWSQLLDVSQCTADRLGWPLPAYIPKPTETVCRKIVASYPWGQSAPTQSLGAEANANFGINANVTVTATGSPANSTEAYLNATQTPNSANQRRTLYNFLVLANTLFLFWLNIPLQKF